MTQSAIDQSSITYEGILIQRLFVSRQMLTLCYSVWFFRIAIVLLLRPRQGAKYCYQLACLSVVCPSALISRKSHLQISRNFLCMLPMARSSCDDSAMRYVGLLVVLWMTSCFHIMEPRGENQRQRCFIELAKWQHMGRSYCLRLTTCWSFSNVK